MSLIALRFTPPDESYEGFKFRIARLLCIVFGFFTLLFFSKHVLVYHAHHQLGLLPEPFRVIWAYLLAYYWRTSGGLLEMLLILAGFAAAFWLNLPKQYFADRYRDYGKERASPEARSLTLLLTLMALVLVLLSVPFLTLHFPVWVSFLVKYGPLVIGVLQYLSILPEISDEERAPAINKLDWDPRVFDTPYRSTLSHSLGKELTACSNLMSPSNPQSARRFLTQGSTTVTWSGAQAFLGNLEAFLGVSAESMTLHEDASHAMEFAVGALLDARGAQATVVLTTDAEHGPIRQTIKDRLQHIYRFQLETVPVQNAIWNNVSPSEIVSVLVKACIEKKPDIAVLSQVFSDTGIVLDLKELIDKVRAENLRTLFVIDGSQAVGNILVEDDIFVRSAYYVFDGDGWLLGRPSVGVLVRNAWLLRITGEVEQPTSAMLPVCSLHHEDLQDTPPTYRDFFPWFALNYVLKHEWLPVGAEKATKHTNNLATLFRDEVHKRDVRTIGIWGESSVVVISGIPQTEAVYHALESKHVECRLVSADVDKAKVQGIRFCFHHYHSDDDVRDLAELIGDLISLQAYRHTPDLPNEPPVPERYFRQSA
ncbi:MAG: aminotransferase class V-fold PLP-dependent enzyme [Acidobacteriaceae bacterium]|nr:aminotransferase class V-fold PLP-dependent enzyme [Acidobacteriaceae bacterium]MBV9778576.1 aminotransferase class V-fold PLP-dependent enzyme [Acidobacteriaceae bacterium]